MNNVVDRGPKLVGRINTANLGTIESVSWARDPFRKFDIVDGLPWTVLSPLSETDIVAAPVNATRSGAELLLTMRVKQTGSAKQALLEEHRESWDRLISVVGVDEQVSSLRDYRRHSFDPVKDQAKLICQATISLKRQCAFGELDQNDQFLYHGQQYRKEDSESAVMLSWCDGESVTEYVSHRFDLDVIVSPTE